MGEPAVEGHQRQRALQAGVLRSPPLQRLQRVQGLLPLACKRHRASSHDHPGHKQGQQRQPQPRSPTHPAARAPRRWPP
eukprot:scaffold3254_cov273-Prasinococcus_capsulatus_cf.AAC.10